MSDLDMRLTLQRSLSLQAHVFDFEEPKKNFFAALNIGHTKRATGTEAIA